MSRLRMKIVRRIKTSYCRCCGEAIRANERRIRLVKDDVIEGTYCLAGECKLAAQHHLRRDDVEDHDHCIETSWAVWQDVERMMNERDEDIFGDED